MIVICEVVFMASNVAGILCYGSYYLEFLCFFRMIFVLTVKNKLDGMVSVTELNNCRCFTANRIDGYVNPVHI